MKSSGLFVIVCTVCIGLGGQACDGGKTPAPQMTTDAGATIDAATDTDTDTGRDAGPDATVLVDLNAGDDDIAAFAGVWSGTTGDKLPVSFVMSEDGTMTDLSVRLEMTAETGGTCTATFVATKVVRVVAGSARLELRTDLDRFRIPVTIDFNSSTAAVGMQTGYDGPYDFQCDDERATGDGPLIPAGRMTLHHTHGVTMPAVGDQLVASGAGSPLPVGDLDGCSQQPGSAARHCAFARIGLQGDNQLWVVAVDQAASAPRPLCDAAKASPGCLLLTRTLYLQEDDSPGLSRFVGDTLSFRAANATSFAAHYVWRPGWTQARLLGDSISSCRMDDKSDAIACMANYHKTDKESWEADLLAGHLGDGSVPLQSIAHIVVVPTADAATPKPVPLFQYEVTDGGQYVVWSARAENSLAAKENVWALKIGEPAANARVLGTDVGRWQLSIDGKKLFWLAGIDRARPGNPQPGHLEMVDFPVPGAPVRILTELTSNYIQSGGSTATPSHQVVVLTPGGALKFVADADTKPLAADLIDDGVSVIHNWSPGAEAVAYGKNVSDGSGWGDLFVAVTANGAVCHADAENQWVSPVFSSSGRYIVARHWSPEPIPTAHLELVDTLTCKSTLLADDAWAWRRLGGDRFLVTSSPVYVRKYSMATVAIVDPNVSRDLSTQIETAATAVGLRERSEPAGDEIELVYSVNAGWKTDGLYRRTIKLPHR
jgi:hypothetical protein